MTKRFLLLMLFLFSPLMAWAANCDGAGTCYVRQGATGSGNGSSWTNACTDFAGACSLSSSGARGGTFFVASGNYGGLGISAADSGTTQITIEGATSGSHGPATDWSDTFQGQAVFPESTVGTDYVTINGQIRNADWRSGYTVKFWNKTNITGCAIRITGKNLAFRYIEIQGTTNIQMSGDTDGDNGICNRINQTNNLYVGYSYVHETGNTQFQLNYGNSTGFICEYNYIYKNHTGWNANHDEAFSLTYSNSIIRYNVMQDIMSSGFICDASGPVPLLSNWEIYGNIFFWDPAYAADSRVFLGDGIVGLFGETWSGHLYFYNNTIVGISNNNTCNASAVVIDIVPGIVIYNNIWMNTNNCGPHDGPGEMMDYNSYYQNSSNSNDNSAHKQTSSSNPFANYTANSLAGFALKASTAAGVTLSAPYNTDLTGAIRGADGVWDRGAYEYNAGASSLPNPPTNIRVSGVQ